MEILVKENHEKFLFSIIKLNKSYSIFLGYSTQPLLFRISAEKFTILPNINSLPVFSK